MSCICPFHNDSRASLFVNFELNAAHCFGCEFSGRATKLVSDFTGWSERVARGNWQSVFQFVGRKSHQIFERPKADYLLQRGFTQKTIEDWDIIYDAERAKICIPAKRRNGSLAGMIYRTVLEEASPKYWFSKGFKVSRHLFGAYKLEPFPPEKIILVEGSLDCIKAHQEGAKNVVALLGWEISKAKLELLKLVSNGVVLCLDTDATGRAATKTTGEKLTNNGFDVSVGGSLRNKDFAASSGEEIHNAIEHSIPYLSWKLQERTEDE